jgi:hypothetical protein
MVARRGDGDHHHGTDACDCRSSVRPHDMNDQHQEEKHDRLDGWKRLAVSGEAEKNLPDNTVKRGGLHAPNDRDRTEGRERHHPRG